ncbi:MAG: polysaccharide export protein, partial [Gammaproteobacteria bacterium]|nr:polysaccharide export protein [Gammaproteobacteria bacterium]
MTTEKNTSAVVGALMRGIAIKGIVLIVGLFSFNAIAASAEQDRQRPTRSQLPPNIEQEAQSAGFSRDQVLMQFNELPEEEKSIVLKQLMSGSLDDAEWLETLPPEVRSRVEQTLAASADESVSEVDTEQPVPLLVEARDVEPLPDSEIQPFGYDLFAGEPSTFAPATDIPIPADYIVGPGDTVNIQLFGKENARYRLTINREGIINFPEIGPLAIAGLKFEDLREQLERQITEQMIGVRISVSIGPLRSIQVFILGDAYRPGSYTVSALSTMTNALLVSGGIKTIGSMRRAELKRNGETIQVLDLYDLLLKGDTSSDARLQPGDVIFIPPVGKTAGVQGAVNRPAIYEFKNTLTA